ncbi:MAG TPA: nucleoside triphosphate pyrophosphohydrolase [Massilibacterium sp.]|nr:nucleoside triphosphate pyrophosphohydrolase [Massilibacterium sp.]
MIMYNKLVRDKVPEIIEGDGLVCHTKQLSEMEFLNEVNFTLYEELEQYTRVQTNEEAIEKLADVLELIHTLTKANGGTIEQLEQIRKQKYEKRGGFEQKTFLIHVTD